MILRSPIRLLTGDVMYWHKWVWLGKACINDVIYIRLFEVSTDRLLFAYIIMSHTGCGRLWDINNWDSLICKWYAAVSNIERATVGEGIWARYLLTYYITYSRHQEWSITKYVPQVPTPVHSTPSPCFLLRCNTLLTSSTDLSTFLVTQLPRIFPMCLTYASLR